MRHIVTGLLLAGAMAAVPAGAILIRADRDDAEYLEMAARYASSVAIDIPGGGEGVLIAPRWVLTSARVGKALQEMKAPPALKFPGREMAVQSVFVHPVWRLGANSADIALVHLARSVSGVAPTALYREDDEGGKGVVIVGHGDTGKIGDKATRQDHRKRGAINTVDRLAARAFMLLVKAGDDASDLQGAFTDGESGAPAYLETKDKEIFVAGIASAPKDTNANGAVDAGDAQVFVRVSAFADWIDATMLQVAKEELNAELNGNTRN
jgi:secreted trypsin-like serine protease